MVRILKILPEQVLNELIRQAATERYSRLMIKDLPKRIFGLAALFALRYNYVLYGSTNYIRNEP